MAVVPPHHLGELVPSQALVLGGAGGGGGFMLQGQHFSYVNISNHLTEKKKKRSLGCSMLNSKEIMKGHFKVFFLILCGLGIGVLFMSMIMS